MLPHLWPVTELRVFAVFVSFFYLMIRTCDFAGMARIRLTAKDASEGAGSGEERDHLSEGEEDLSNVDADLLELMKQDKPEPTLRIGPSLISAALLESYVERGYFPAGVCRPPQAKETPNPEDGECVVFHDFFCRWASVSS